MYLRNVTVNRHDTYDCEINHPKFGWIPFTANPDDPEEHGRLIYAYIQQEVDAGRDLNMITGE
jgi:hypothetical protein